MRLIYINCGKFYYIFKVVTNRKAYKLLKIFNSMDPNNYKTIENFVKGFEKVDEIIKERNPDCIIAPMFGAIPFIDVLNIINEEFPNEKVEYVPASNKIYRVKDVLRGAFENLISKHYSEDGTDFLSLDEIVSGNSLVRVQKQFEAAKQDYANKKTIEFFGDETDFTLPNIKAFRDLRLNLIRYNTVGIVDSKMKRFSRSKNKSYHELLGRGIVIPIEIDNIVTMDRTDYFPAKYKQTKDSEGKNLYLPVVDEFRIENNYVDFLTTVSEILGKDSSNVTVRNIGKIRDSYKLVPENLRKI